MTQIQLRRGTASEWSAANPVLAAGEVGVIGTTGDFKIGDGATTWNLLPAQSSRYVPLAGGVLLRGSAAIPTATPTDIIWSVEDLDPDGWHVVNSVGVIVPAGKGGRYIVSYLGDWSGSPGAAAGMSGFINGTGTYDTGGLSVFATYTHTLTYVRTLAAGDTLKFACYHTVGADRQLDSRLEIAPI